MAARGHGLITAGRAREDRADGRGGDARSVVAPRGRSASRVEVERERLVVEDFQVRVDARGRRVRNEL